MHLSTQVFSKPNCRWCRYLAESGNHCEYELIRRFLSEDGIGSRTYNRLIFWQLAATTRRCVNGTCRIGILFASSHPSCYSNWISIKQFQFRVTCGGTRCLFIGKLRCFFCCLYEKPIYINVTHRLVCCLFLLLNFLFIFSLLE